MSLPDVDSVHCIEPRRTKKKMFSCFQMKNILAALKQSHFTGE